MKKMRILTVLAMLGSVESLFAYKLMIYNKSDYPAYVNVVARSSSESNSRYFGVALNGNEMVHTTDDNYYKADKEGLILAGRIIKPGETKYVVYDKDPRAIWVRFAANENTPPSQATLKTISFPFSEVNSEIYLQGIKSENIAQGSEYHPAGVPLSVAFWNKVALGGGKAFRGGKDLPGVFPGLNGSLPVDAQGNISAADIAKITPSADQAWNINKDRNDDIYRDSALLMFDQSLNPKTN